MTFIKQYQEIELIVVTSFSISGQPNSLSSNICTINSNVIVTFAFQVERTRKSSVSLNAATPRSSLLHCSFVPSSSLSFPSSFSGLSLGLDLSSSIGVGRRRGSGLVVRAGKAALCLTKRNRSRKSMARTHGFRRRMRTTGGRAMLKRRRAKGRKILCTKTNPNSGKRA